MEFCEWYEASGKLIQRTVLGWMPGHWADMEDIRQEVGLIAYTHWNQLKNHPNLMGWTVRTTRYRICHRLREWKRMADWDSEKDLECQMGEAVAAEEQYIQEVGLLEDLQSDRDYVLLYLHEIEGYPYRDLESLTGISAITLRKRVQRVRERLADRERLVSQRSVRGHSQVSVI